MRISRTIIILILTAAAVVLKYFGIDIDLGDPEIAEGGWTLMEIAAWLLGVAAYYFRTKATAPTNALGVKTSDPLN